MIASIYIIAMNQRSRSLLFSYNDMVSKTCSYGQQSHQKQYEDIDIHIWK